jgi:hypothetical protein
LISFQLNLPDDHCFAMMFTYVRLPSRPFALAGTRRRARLQFPIARRLAANFEWRTATLCTTHVQLKTEEFGSY